MLSKGKFIVIEGLDRSGKSTQAEILLQRLKTRLGTDQVKLIKFPGKMIDAYLRSSTELDDHAIHLLFSANRWEVRSSILSDLASGMTIVCDRYAFSGIAFSVSKGTLPFDWCQHPDIGLPCPDLVLFFDISPEVAKLRGGYGEERYEKEEMQKNVRLAFKRIIANDKKEGDGKVRWVELDAGQGVEEVTANVWIEVEKVLKEENVQDVGRLWMNRVQRDTT
ncbi:Thymidylate kinase [Tulasnella sp. 331]|nr:Thymidylate kinase [Tulasnella sp. 331]KAG8879579.1 Thymidylate kinase [Tulasnella sp. 332]